MADDNDPTQAQEGDSDLVRNLRDTIKSLQTERDEEKATRMQVEKRSAFKDLGINPEKGVGRLFYENYDGELSVDAVKAAAQEYELPIGQQQTQTSEQQTTPQPQSQQPSSEAQQHSTIDAAVEGAGEASQTNSPDEKAWQAHDEVYSKTGSRDKAMAAHFGAKLEAALDGQKKQ